MKTAEMTYLKIEDLARMPEVLRYKEHEQIFNRSRKHIKKKLLTGAIEIDEDTIYSIRPVTSTFIAMFQPGDKKNLPLRNLKDGRLPRYTVMLLEKIALLMGIPDSIYNEEEIGMTEYHPIEEDSPLANGTFTLRVDGQEVLKDIQNIHFVRRVSHNLEGIHDELYELPEWEFIHDESQIEFDIQFETLAGIPKNVHILVSLVGAMTCPLSLQD